MAERVQVLLVCDVHGDDTPGEEKVFFAVDGASYEIDVCAQHGGELRDALAPYVGVARRSGGGGGGRRGRRGRRPGSSARGGIDPAEVRSWARGKGIAVNERGRIPGHVIEQYLAGR